MLQTMAISHEVRSTNLDPPPKRCNKFFYTPHPLEGRSAGFRIPGICFQSSGLFSRRISCVPCCSQRYPNFLCALSNKEHLQSQTSSKYVHSPVLNQLSYYSPV
ncbi:hypothetical protein TNCV_1929411 [Trichonephila clavipes]|nr:hypothetical protein TNCV_1929411 [Trichonephila clavipes]